MKKILTIIALILILAVGIFLLAGCGNANGESTKKDDLSKGVTSGAGNNLKNVTESNYKDVAKEVYGMEITDYTGWTLKTAQSPNKVNNLNIDYVVSNGEDGKGIIESYFNKAVALGKVYDYKSMTKGTEYTSFDIFAENNLTKISTLCQSMWVYEFNGKDILFTISVNDEMATISFVLLG